MTRIRVVAAVLGVLLLPAGVAGCQEIDTIAGAGTSGTTMASASTTTTVQVTTTAQVTTTVVTTGPPTRWTKYDLSEEPIGYLAEMVHVPTIRKALIFGGSPGGDDPWYSSGTYGYDPEANAWVPFGVRGPSGRVGHSMVYVPTLDRVILFGGNEGAFYYPYLGDLWSYDPRANTWTELRPEGDRPSARTGQRMVFDPNTGKVIMFGGKDQDGAMTGLWAYDPEANSWSRPKPGGDKPGVRYGHAMVYDPITRKILLYGGLAGENYGAVPAEILRLNDLWAYDTVANEWMKLKPARSPGYRSYTRMVYHPGSGLTIMFGGEGRERNSYPTTLWAYDSVANNWTQLSPADRIPFGRSGHVMVYDPFSGEIIMYGGEKSDGTHLRGTWTLTP